MFDTSSEQPSASSVIVVSNTSSYHHTSESDVINAAFTEAFGSVCDASYYFKNLIDFHQSHFHHLHKHHVINLNLNVKSTSTETSSEEASAPLTNTTNLSQERGKKKRKQEEPDSLKQNKIEDNLINLKLENSNLDENLNVKTNLARAKRPKLSSFNIKKLIFKKYKKLSWTKRRVPARSVKRRSRFRRVRRPALQVEPPADTTTDTYVSYQTGYYYSNDAELTHTQFYEEQSTLYQPGVARTTHNHDLLKLSYDKFKQFRLNEKLLQQTVLIRNAIKLLQYELQYQHEQEIQQQYLYQQQQHHQQHQQQQHHLQQHMVMDYNQNVYQHPLMQMNPSVYESVEDVMSRSVESASLVQTTNYYVNDVNRISVQDEQLENIGHMESKQTDNDHNTQTVNQSAENIYF